MFQIKSAVQFLHDLLLSCSRSIVPSSSYMICCCHVPDQECRPVPTRSVVVMFQIKSSVQFLHDLLLLSCSRSRVPSSSYMICCCHVPDQECRPVPTRSVVVMFQIKSAVQFLHDLLLLSCSRSRVPSSSCMICCCCRVSDQECRPVPTRSVVVMFQINSAVQFLHDLLLSCSRSRVPSSSYTICCCHVPDQECRPVPT